MRVRPTRDIIRTHIDHAEHDNSYMRPDKEKVIDEVWDDERIEGFLAKSPMGDEQSRDYSALLYAYRSMRPGDFERFIERFVATDRDVNATSNDGRTLLETIAGHRHGEPFRDILIRHGAR
jgi:hypothetical protein